MAKSKSNLSDRAAWKRGVSLAIALLRDCEAADAPDKTTLLWNIRAEDGPQENIVHRFLIELRQIDDERVYSAFGAVLSDFIASSHEVQLSADHLEQLTRRPIATSPERRPEQAPEL